MNAADKDFLVDERAAILEFDAGMAREQAESLALSRADEMEAAWLHSVQGENDG